MPLYATSPTLELPFRVNGRSSTWAPEGLLALVGRADRCQLVLTDNTISNYHAAFVRTPLGLWVIDLASREGVYVNEMRVRWAWLANGDQVRMGSFTTVLRYETAPEGISREDVPLGAGASPSSLPGLHHGVAPASVEHDRRILAVRSDVRSTGLVRAEDAALTSGPALTAAIAGAEWEPVQQSGPTAAALWQQQMQIMQSFHNDMIMMFRMFVAMHDEHVESVRDEFDRVQQLTQELIRLNVRLGQLSVSAEISPPSDIGDQKVGSRTVSQPGSAKSKGTTHPPRQTGSRTEQELSGKREHRPGTIGHSAPVAGNPGQSRTGPPPPMGIADTYADLTRRIAEIQDERQGYWRSIFKVINK